MPFRFTNEHSLIINTIPSAQIERGTTITRDGRDDFVVDRQKQIVFVNPDMSTCVLDVVPKKVQPEHRNFSDPMTMRGLNVISLSCINSSIFLGNGFSCYGNYSSSKEYAVSRRFMRVGYKSRGMIIGKTADNESVAIESLREMISETDYRRYVKYGFIVVDGENGRKYQIFRDQQHIKIWCNGK